MDRYAGDLDRCVREPVQHRPQRGDLAVGRHVERKRIGVASRVAEPLRRLLQVSGLPELDADVAARDEPLQL